MTQSTDTPDPAAPDAPHSSVRSVQYKGADLDGDRGPGLGCFRFQLIVLVTLIVVTPLGVNAGWPDWLTAALLFATLALLLVAGQTIIFLLRLVAADRRGRRRPLASGTRTVGELDDAAQGAMSAGTGAETGAETGADSDSDAGSDRADAGSGSADAGADGVGPNAPSHDGRDGDPSVRQ